MIRVDPLFVFHRRYLHFVVVAAASAFKKLMKQNLLEPKKAVGRTTLKKGGGVQTHDSAVRANCVRRPHSTAVVTSLLISIITFYCCSESTFSFTVNERRSTARRKMYCRNL
jgi:hypothetical protein